MCLRLQHVSVALVVVALCLVASDAAADASLIDRIRSAWQEREKAARTFVVEWDEQVAIPKGMAGKDKQGKGLPPQDAVYTIRHRMVGSGNRLRLDRSGQRYDVSKREIIDKQFVRVFDGRERRELFFGEYKKDHPGGFLNKIPFFDDGSYLGIQPVVLSFRPLRTELGGIDLATFKVSELRGSVDGIACHVLERPHGGSGVDRLWLAQEGDFRILRRQLGRAERPAEELTLSYEPDSKGNCNQWTYVMRSSGDVPREMSASKTTKLQTNVPVDEAEFQYEFPRGAIVNYEDSDNFAIARDDGSLRPVTAGELAAGISPETLMKTDPLPEAREPNRRWSMTFMAWCVMAGIVMASCVFYYRYRRRQPLI